MIINTKYQIGDVFYMAKCRKIYTGDDIRIIYGEEYKRSRYYYEPSVRKLTIVGITETIGRDAAISYSLKYEYPTLDGSWKTQEFPHRHRLEAEMSYFFRTIEEALTCANEFVDKKEEYHGEPSY